MSAWASPHTPLGETQHSPDPLAGFNGGCFAAGGNGRKGRRGEGREGLGGRAKSRRGEGEWGREEEGGGWGNSELVVGG